MPRASGVRVGDVGGGRGGLRERAADYLPGRPPVWAKPFRYRGVMTVGKKGQCPYARAVCGSARSSRAVLRVAPLKGLHFPLVSEARAKSSLSRCGVSKEGGFRACGYRYARRRQVTAQRIDRRLSGTRLAPAGSSLGRGGSRGGRAERLPVGQWHKESTPDAVVGLAERRPWQSRG